MKVHINGWFRPSPDPVRLVVRSERYELPIHFVPKIGSCRCACADCALCASIGEPTLKFVHVIDRGGSFFLIEISTDVFARPLEIGEVIFFTRKRIGDYWQTFLEVLDKQPATRIWPTNYIEALGRAAYDRAVLNPRQLHAAAE